MIRNSGNAIGDITSALQERGLFISHWSVYVTAFGERTGRARVGARSGGTTNERLNEAVLPVTRSLYMQGWRAVVHARFDEAPVIEVLLTEMDT